MEVPGQWYGHLQQLDRWGHLLKGPINISSQTHSSQYFLLTSAAGQYNHRKWRAQCCYCQDAIEKYSIFVPSDGHKLNQNPTSHLDAQPHLLLLWKVQHGTWLVSFPTTAEREWFHLPNIHPPIKHCRHMARNTISRAQLYLITLTLCVCHRSLSLTQTYREKWLLTEF